MISDPMADLTGDQSGAGQDPSQMSNRKEVVDPLVIQVNMQRVDRIRSVMGIVSGCAAGILGFNGLGGLGM